MVNREDILGGNKLSKEFYECWETKVKPIVLKIVSPEQFKIIGKGNNVSDEEVKVLQGWVDTGLIEDLTSAYYIGFMARDIETARLNYLGGTLQLINSVNQVTKVLSHDGTFFKNVWKDEINTEFRKNVYDLGGVMPELLELL